VQGVCNTLPVLHKLATTKWRNILKPRADLAIEIIDDELVVLDKEAGEVHQFNASASLVWHSLAEGLTGDEIAVRLSKTFGVELGVATSDVEKIIAQFESLELIVEECG